jgi:hypothetical protein
MTPGLLGGSKGIRTPDPLTPCKNKRDRSGGGVGKILYKYGEESTNHPQHKGPKFALCGVLWSPWRDHVVTFALIRSNTPSALQNRRAPNVESLRSLPKFLGCRSSLAGSTENCKTPANSEFPAKTKNWFRFSSGHGIARRFWGLYRLSGVPCPQARVRPSEQRPSLLRCCARFAWRVSA